MRGTRCRVSQHLVRTSMVYLKICVAVVNHSSRKVCNYTKYVLSLSTGSNQVPYEYGEVTEKAQQNNT